MKQTLIFIALILCAATAAAQAYIGTMTVGTYTQKNVEAQLTVNGDKASLFVKQTKFSRFMPVKVDVTFNDIEVSTKEDNPDEVALRAEGIVPTTKSKKWEKYTVTEGRGHAGQTCLFECMMAGKKVVYKGKKVEK